MSAESHRAFLRRQIAGAYGLRPAGGYDREDPDDREAREIAFDRETERRHERAEQAAERDRERRGTKDE